MVQKVSNQMLVTPGGSGGAALTLLDLGTSNHTVTLAELTAGTVFRNSGASNLTITLPSGLGPAFGGLCGLQRTGAGTLTLVASGTTVADIPAATVPQHRIDFVQWSDGENYSYLPEVPAASGGVTPLTVAMNTPNATPNSIVMTLSRAGYQATLPASSALTATKNGSAWTVSSWAWTNATTITATMGTSAVGGDALAATYAESTTARIRSLDNDIPLQSFTAQTVTNSVGVGAAYLRFVTLGANAVESGAGPYTYTNTVGFSGGTGAGGSLKFPAGASSVTMTMKLTAAPAAATCYVGVYLDTDNTTARDFSVTLASIVAGWQSNGSGTWYTVTSAGIGTSSSVAAATNTQVRINRPTPTTVTLDVFDGTSWTTGLGGTITVANVDLFVKIHVGANPAATISFQALTQTGMT